MWKPSEIYLTIFVLNLLKANSTRALSGSLNRLIFTVYEVGSAYDNQVMHIINEGGIACSKEAVTESISCGPPTEPAVQEPLSECCNTSNGRNQSIKRAKGTLCFVCGASGEAHPSILTID